MVGGFGTEILRGLLEGHIAPQAPGAPPLQLVTQESIVVERNTGSAYVFSRHQDNVSIFFYLKMLLLQEKCLTGYSAMRQETPHLSPLSQEPPMLSRMS